MAAIQRQPRDCVLGPKLIARSDAGLGGFGHRMHIISHKASTAGVKDF